MNQPCFGRPAAAAHISGIDNLPRISGIVRFFNANNGTLVVADIYNLPSGGVPADAKIFGFHIHEGRACSGPDLANTGGHFNPSQRPHPYHAGDLPPLFEAGGRAYMAVLTGRFRVPDIIGRTVVIHSDPDDFRSQPAGDAGDKIACGVIRELPV